MSLQHTGPRIKKFSLRPDHGTTSNKIFPNRTLPSPDFPFSARVTHLSPFPHAWWWARGKRGDLNLSPPVITSSFTAAPKKALAWMLCHDLYEIFLILLFLKWMSEVICWGRGRSQWKKKKKGSILFFFFPSTSFLGHTTKKEGKKSIPPFSFH